ncbi:MAG TPA: NAD(P)/FAD-dependent oxidoreductase [Candidatus Saccharimonadales bacterium]|nr:NAD(P)/FAD-dependent oxidoreductase [Candidatus Saccharimonadales bacterium]
MGAIKKAHITIVGGGLGGSFLAILLANRGYKVTLYEKLTKEAISDTNTKRSYNITFRSFGISMLKEAGVWETLRPHLLPLKGSYTKLSKNADPIYSFIDENKNDYLAVSRTALLTVLMDEMTKNSLISLHFNTSLLSINKHDKTIIIQDNKTKKIETKQADIIIGADGANSTVRLFLQQGQDSYHSQEYSTGGYKQFTITKNRVKELDFRSDLAYTWSSKEKTILAFPNFDGSLACLLVYPKNKKAFETLTSEKAIKKLIDEDFPNLSSISKEIAEQLIENPVGSFVTIHTNPWIYKDFITLIGDAAHGFYPFFGQGTSAAFGDCMQLVTIIDQYAPNWNKVFKTYQEKRQRHMDALGELSKEGLMRYMRNKRADFDAIYDKLEAMGNEKFPNFIKGPIFQSVINDPAHTADYVDAHNKQRKIAQKIGISLMVKTLTKALDIKEKISK